MKKVVFALLAALMIAGCTHTKEEKEDDNFIPWWIHETK